MEGDGVLVDKDSDTVITKEMIYEAVSMFSGVIEYLQDWESGVFHLSHEEYLMSPNVLTEIRSIWKRREK